MADELEQQAQFPLQRGYCCGTVTDDDGNEVEEIFALRSTLTIAERIWVIERMRRQAWALMTHADALLSETDALIAAGKLATEDEA